MDGDPNPNNPNPGGNSNNGGGDGGGSGSGSGGSSDSATIIAELRAELARQAEENSSLAVQYKEMALRALPADVREEAKKVLEAVEVKADLDSRERQLEEMARDIKAERLAIDNKDFGVTVEQLKAAKTPEEMELIVERAKVAHYEQKEKSGGSDGKGAGNLGSLPSDRGAGGTGAGGAPKPIEGKGRDAVAAHIGEFFREKRGG